MVNSIYLSATGHRVVDSYFNIYVCVQTPITHFPRTSEKLLAAFPPKVLLGTEVLVLVMSSNMDERYQAIESLLGRALLLKRRAL